MKFLPPELTRPHIIPLNITYYQPSSFEENDVLTIIFKDQDSNQKIVHEIKNPIIEIYIVKPEFRTFTHMRDWMESSKCDVYKVKYRSRWKLASNKLGLSSPDEAKTSPYIFNADIAIETYYLIQFTLEYPSDATQKLSLGFLDIENDIIQCDDFPKYGETPINAITYINIELRDVYTLVLCKDNLPIIPSVHPAYKKILEMKEDFYNQVNKFKDNIPAFIEKCHNKFDELYGDMNYNILCYDDEISLNRDIWKIIHATDNDYIGIWNSPYDMQNLIKRPAFIGENALEIIPDERFSIKMVSFKEDTNPMTHKRKHDCNVSTIPTFVDDMVHYAGIRSGRGTLASTKLNAIAKKELSDEKYDYSEVSDIKHLYYNDFERFVLYNIKDVLLLTGISAKTKDMNTIYSRMYQMAVFPKEAFTTTKVVWHSLIKFMYNLGYVPGTNRNKGIKNKKMIDYGAQLRDRVSSDNEIDEDFDEDEYFDIVDPDSDNDSDEDSKDEKYSGAYVANTLHMQPTGVNILGKAAKFIHNNAADLDVESEYPTAITTCNISNETLVGKVYLANPEAIVEKIPDGFIFSGDDLERHKFDPSNYMMELYSQGNILGFSTMYLGLPSVKDMMKDIDNMIKK